MLSALSQDSVIILCMWEGGLRMPGSVLQDRVCRNDGPGLDIASGDLERALCFRHVTGGNSTETTFKNILQNLH